MSRAYRSGGELWVCHLGVVGYRDGLSLQEQLRDARERGTIPDVLLLLEHTPVYTRGRRTGPGELPMGDAFYRDRGIEVLDSDRGGRVTYHGPGQLVGYPIMAVEDVGRFVRTMEAAIISALAEEGVEARARPEDGADYTGVWVQERKIASIGVHVRRGIATHGFAVNVCNDLDPFTWIVPCGLQGVAMTSLSLESPAACSMACFRRRSAHAFAEAHERRQRLVSPWRLRRAAADPSGRAARRAPLEIDTRRLGTVPA